MKIKLFYVEFLPSCLGAWDREWYATRKEADAAFTRKRAEGFSTRVEGTQGALEHVTRIEVELTPQGVLDFARHYAVDRG
jgi:hypothetical protein